MPYQVVNVLVPYITPGCGEWLKKTKQTKKKQWRHLIRVEWKVQWSSTTWAGDAHASYIPLNSLAGQSFLTCLRRKQTDVKTLNNSYSQTQTVWVCLWNEKKERKRERKKERWSEWLHQVLIYHDSKCTQSIKNYLGTEHWPLSNK